MATMRRSPDGECGVADGGSPAKWYVVRGSVYGARAANPHRDLNALLA
jgi:hypothetical protein